MPSERPEWRKEVADKVKAYGEKKKQLLTPPGPIKEKPQEPERPSVPEESAQTSNRRFYPETRKPAPPQEPSRPDYFRPAPKAKPALPPLEICVDDIEESVLELPRSAPEIVVPVLNRNFPRAEFALIEESEPQHSQESVFFWRRTASMIVDHFILLILYFGISCLMTFVPQVMHESTDAPFFQQLYSLFLHTPFLMLSVFLLVHFLYYMYFYISPRQTPGMLFFALEIRSSLSSTIPLHRVLVRWLSLLLLNVFNIIPVLQGKKRLLLDDFSGTQIRSLK